MTENTKDPDYTRTAHDTDEGREPESATGSGRGGGLGTPGRLPDEKPPSFDQDANEAVSGGGMIGPEDGEPSDSVERT